MMITSQGMIGEKEIQKENFPLLFSCLALVLITIITYWPVKDFDFVNFDDNFYVYENARIQQGVTWKSIQWAYSVESMKTTGNWHPLTWLSLMMDYQIFDLNPHGYHLMNLLFHVINTVLLFLIFHRMTKSLRRSAFVACLFAIHPLHVESVAWVTERKDVLSSFFWMLTTAAYVHYVEHPKIQRYLYVFLFFVAGLMAKPMLVSLPFVLLLLDYWPLKRFQTISSVNKIQKEINEPIFSNKRKVKPGKSVAYNFQWSFVRPLLWEKLPLLTLSALSAIITYIAQQRAGMVLSIKTLPVCSRILNAFVSYIVYIEKTIWPQNLSILYPYQIEIIWWQFFGAILIILFVSGLVWRHKKRFPYLIVGWLWYLGTLLPVLGMIQVGSQAYADRYTYIPLIGLFIMVSWGISEFLKGWSYGKEMLITLSVLSLLSLSMVTCVQIRYWLNSIALWDHTLIVTDHNSMAYNSRGNAYSVLGAYAKAIRDFDKAIEINPNFATAYKNRGFAYLFLGNRKQATEDLKVAAKFGNGKAQNFLRSQGINW